MISMNTCCSRASLTSTHKYSGTVDLDALCLSESISTCKHHPTERTQAGGPTGVLETSSKLLQKAGRAVPFPGLWAGMVQDERGNPGTCTPTVRPPFMLGPVQRIGCQKLGPCNPRIKLV